MPNYIVHLWFNANQKFNVEAKDEETAEENAIQMAQEACQGIPIETTDAVVTLSDSQYSDQQELLDREGQD